MSHRRSSWEDSDPVRSCLNEDPLERWFDPDGRTPWSINFLIATGYRESRNTPAPTSALLDGSAIETRLERMAKRALAALRSVPTVREDRVSDRASVPQFVTDARTLMRPAREPEVA
jgi:hypothetical protein